MSEDSPARTIRRIRPGEPPPREAWNKLVASLALATDAEPNASLPEGMPAVLEMLAAFNDYIAPQDVTNREKLAVPLLRLVEAIVDLSKGLKPKLFEPTKRSAYRPKKSSAETNLMGTCALAVEKLLESGLTRAVAVKRVQAALKKRAAPRIVEKTTLLGWRERIMQGKGGRMPPEVMARFSSPLPIEAGASPAEQAVWLLNLLTESPVLDFG